MIDDKNWPPTGGDKEGPTPEELEERAAGANEEVGGENPGDAAGSGNPQPMGNGK